MSKRKKHKKRKRKRKHKKPKHFHLVIPDGYRVVGFQEWLELKD